MGFEDEIRRFVRRQFESGNVRNLRKRVREFIKENGFEESFKNDVQRLIKSVENDLFEQFKNDYSGGEDVQKKAEDILSAYAQRHINEIQDMALYSLKYIDRRLIREISQAIEQGIKGDLNWQETARAALRKYKLRKRHIETEINTTQAALDRLARIEQIKQSGAKYVRYAGPTGTVRPFCVRHIGGVYRIEEIEGKLNRFRQPALYYMGGYNCRHRWVPMEGKEIYRQKNGQGRVFVEQGFKERSKEITIAKLRARSGFRIVLRNATGPKGIKLADTWENGRAVEYKRLTSSATNITEATRRQIRNGKKQAGHVLLYNEGSLAEDLIIEGIKKAIKFDDKREIKQVTILKKNGTFITKNREGWEND
ncbi:hypothetical protein Calab_1514 [Caldithrix abyssi DSM 13497]|uniref:tRNA nuclease CdiA C-terminal domain-containing protein n=1 Tax=Caldithrix abyssi DSM 13497 TaxID=880073 RepID=H1XTF1_CALAY|nr:hypothetical protein [Caldithrix abyssi]APF16977.1 hypothetical protein Cabys_226 [Caldithrix abyssi DSM 13497]APF20334.1 hypothetical protein Cabys_3588 [Caldithrix abyssi DSM 13497]EHO40384.1 hypothetical protein Calab_0745 [Caldithrix abyssi DSM 13497]EHO41134.1 hypothetical protein Calab_1514 [Caldithrix abyssi DSM 13497]